MPYMMNDTPKPKLPKLTPWYPGHIKPVRKGVYMLMSGSGRNPGYQLWDGKKWGPWFDTAEDAAATHRGDYATAAFQNDAWRGLAQDPRG